MLKKRRVNLARRYWGALKRTTFFSLIEIEYKLLDFCLVQFHVGVANYFDRKCNHRQNKEKGIREIFCGSIKVSEKFGLRFTECKTFKTSPSSWKHRWNFRLLSPIIRNFKNDLTYLEFCVRDMNRMHYNDL